MVWYLNLPPLVELCENFRTWAVTCHVSISNLTFLSHRSWLLFSITSSSPPLPSTHVLSTSSVLHLHQCFYFSLPSPLTPFHLASPCFLIPPVLFLRPFRYFYTFFTPLIVTLACTQPSFVFYLLSVLLLIPQLSPFLTSTSSNSHLPFPLPLCPLLPCPLPSPSCQIEDRKELGEAPPGG